MAKSTTPRKPRNPAPADETKSQKFSRLASARMTKVLKQIKGLGNLSGSGYEFTPEQVAKMATMIEEATRNTMKRFDKTQRATADQVTI